MTWARIDDKVFEHEKLRELSKDAKLLFFAGITRAARHETDGRLTPTLLRWACADADVDASVAAELVAAKLWTSNGEDYWIHDFLEYNPSAEQLDERRRQNSERQRRFRERRRDDLSVDEGDNGVSNAPYPYPRNPVPEEPKTPLPGPNAGARDAREREGTPEEPDEVLEAVCQAVYGKPARLVMPSERDEAHIAADELEAQSISPPEIAARGEAWRRNWPQLTRSPSALVRNWTRLGELVTTQNGSSHAAHQHDRDAVADERRRLFAAAGLGPDNDDARARPAGDAGGPDSVPTVPESPAATGGLPGVQRPRDGVPSVSGRSTDRREPERRAYSDDVPGVRLHAAEARPGHGQAAAPQGSRPAGVRAGPTTRG